MQLTHLEVSNFKALKQITYDPEAFSCIVGENNAGKSSVLQSITLLINRPTSVSPANFYDQAKPITLTGTFGPVGPRDLKRLAPEHEEKIKPLVVDGLLTIRVSYTPDGKMECLARRKVPKEKRFTQDFIDEALKGKKGQSLVEAFAEHYSDCNIAVTKDHKLMEAKQILAQHISSLAPDCFDDSFVPLPSGIPASIKALLPDAIYVPAVKNVNDDLKTTQSTSFGRLLTLLLGEIGSDLTDFQRALEKLDALFNRVKDTEGIKDDRHDRVKYLEETIESFLGEHFPAAKVELHIPPPELKTILNSAQIFIDDGSKDLIDNKGDGIKRSLMFALLRTYVAGLKEDDSDAADEQVDKPSKQPLMFLFEEPELYLHPRAQKVLFVALNKISHQHQVIITTHSPLFFEPNATASFARMAKAVATPKPVAILHPVSFILDTGKAETFRLAKFEHADAAFFSSAVVLFEGESDEHFLQHLSAISGGTNDFARNNVSLVRVGGKGNFAKFREFFKAFGIPVVTIVDLDGLFDGFEHLGGSNEASVLRSTMIQSIDEILAQTTVVPELSGRRIKEKVNRPAWKERYESVKSALSNVRDGEVIPIDTVSKIEKLFEWETTDKRLCAAQTVEAAKQVIRPLLAKLRQENIVVLSKGAIEDYYPEGVSNSVPKPQRALEACDAVKNADDMSKLSAPLGEGEGSELDEMFKLVSKARTEFSGTGDFVADIARTPQEDAEIPEQAEPVLPHRQIAIADG